MVALDIIIFVLFIDTIPVKLHFLIVPKLQLHWL